MHRCCLWSVLLAATLGGCVLSQDDSQTITGRVERTGFDGMALGARVIQGDTVIVTAPLDSDGNFTVAVPPGTGYRLEIVTSTGAHPFVQHAGGELIEHAFDVCDPGDPFDLGDVYQGDSYPEEWDGEDPGTGCGDPPPPDWCPADVPEEECWDPCLWDPMACEDPCALYPETCDPCAKDPSRCEDPCLEHPEWCVDPCEEDPSLCEDPCAIDPTLCMCPDGSTNCDPCEANPEMCDPCVLHPELCDPCLEDPSLCDPCATRPELCEDPDPCMLYPELCDPCVGDPDLCDPCLEHPELCDDPCALYPEMCDPCLLDPTLCESPCEPGADGSYDDENCWPVPEDPPCDMNGVCDPDGCAVPEEPIPDFGCGEW